MKFTKGSIPWNKGTKGIMKAWNKGKICPQISKIMKGRKVSIESKEKMRQAKLKNPVRYWLNRKRPELKNTNAIKTMFKKGFISPIKGKKRPEWSGEKHPNWKGGPPKCLECGKTLGTSSYKTKRCGKHRLAHLRGKNSRLWKGGITSKSRLERVRFRYSMQKLVFERDNYTCQMCGATRDLQVDHIQSWAEYVELRFNIDNCRTLCSKCHYKVTFGKPMPKNIKNWGYGFSKGVMQNF